MAQTKLKASYDKMASGDREQYLERARDAAKLTIPSLMPDEGATSSTSYSTPWQSIGSRGTNNLASKIILAMFPPGSSFFKQDMNEAERAELDDVTKGEIDKALSAFERVVTDDIEDSQFRSTMYQAARHLVVTGNGLLFDDPDNGMRLYSLDRYVIKRDAAGKAFRIIAKDTTMWQGLSDELKASIQASSGMTVRNDDDDVDIYTGIMLKEDTWHIHQEIDDVKVPDSESTYKVGESPWMPIRPIALDGESYGRGFVEEIYGDLNTVDVLTQAVTEGAGIASLVKFLVDPNGQTDKDDLIDTPNGGFASGRERDISVLRVDKGGDLRVAVDTMQAITERLARAFLLNSGATRDAERVTAEEIRFVAQEIDDALGGIYSVLSQELQLPLVKWRIKSLTTKGLLPKLPKEVKTKIITGLEALGRGQEHQRLRAFIGDAAQVVGEVLPEYLKVSEYLKRAAAALSVDTEGLIRTEEEVQQARQDQRDAEVEAQQALQQQPQGQPQQ